MNRKTAKPACDATGWFFMDAPKAFPLGEGFDSAMTADVSKILLIK